MGESRGGRPIANPQSPWSHPADRKARGIVEFDWAFFWISVFKALTAAEALAIVN
jgi:hypothetical protein